MKHWFSGNLYPLSIQIPTKRSGPLKTIGEPDERTNQYHKHWAYVVLMTILVCDIIFPKEYLVMQFFVYKYALAVLAGDIYFYIQYNKDFS